VPTAFVTQVDLLSGHGRLYDITNFENERRTDLGLPAIVEKAEDYERILAATGLNALGEAAGGG
jgi:heterodisulfide reductase subunit C